MYAHVIDDTGQRVRYYCGKHKNIFYNIDIQFSFLFFFRSSNSLTTYNPRSTIHST